MAAALARGPWTPLKKGWATTYTKTSQASTRTTKPCSPPRPCLELGGRRGWRDDMLGSLASVYPGLTFPLNLRWPGVRGHEVRSRHEFCINVGMYTAFLRTFTNKSIARPHFNGPGMQGKPEAGILPLWLKHCGPNGNRWPVAPAVRGRHVACNDDMDCLDSDPGLTSQARLPLPASRGMTEREGAALCHKNRLARPAGLRAPGPRPTARFVNLAIIHAALGSPTAVSTAVPSGTWTAPEEAWTGPGRCPVFIENTFSQQIRVSRIPNH